MAGLQNRGTYRAASRACRTAHVEQCRTALNTHSYYDAVHEGLVAPHTLAVVARTDRLELYAHECRQDLWTVSNRERVARRAACHLSVAGAQVLGQVKVVGAVGVVVLTVLLTVRVVPAPAPIRIEPEGYPLRTSPGGGRAGAAAGEIRKGLRLDHTLQAAL